MKCKLVKRNGQFDVYLNGIKYGSGPWGYVTTAHYFYLKEGYQVEVVE